MQCPKCGGQLIPIYWFLGHYICDVCWFVTSLDGASLDKTNLNKINNNDKYKEKSLEEAPCHTCEYGHCGWGFGKEICDKHKTWLNKLWNK